jgi:Tol biopolymer transport system component
VAANGSLVYVRGSALGGDQQTLVSVDRQGRGVPLPGLPNDSYGHVRLSPDGTRLALGTQDDVWIYDFTGAKLSRLTTDPAPDHSPLWTLDGRRIVYTSRRAGYPELFLRPADGSGSDQRFLTRAKDLVDLRASSWSQDGSRLLFIEVTEVPPSRQSAVWQIAPTDPSDAKVLLQSAYQNDHASVSPNGRWIAYESNVSGRNEIYVQRYPESGSRQLISTGGGRFPVWSRDGSELFFTQGGKQMLAVPVRSGTTFDAGPPKVLFEFAMGAAPLGNARPYDIARDGRFLIIGNGGAETGRPTEPSIIVVQNWFEELKRLVPVN